MCLLKHMALIFLSNSRVPERKTLCSDGSAHNYPTKHQKYWIFIPIFLFFHLELKQLLLVSCQMATSDLSQKQQWVERVCSYLYSECVAGTASWEWYNGAGQQNWCRVFKDLRHKEKHKVKPPGAEKGAF